MFGLHTDAQCFTFHNLHLITRCDSQNTTSNTIKINKLCVTERRGERRKERAKWYEKSFPYKNQMIVQ